MATIKKTFETRLDSVTIIGDTVRAAVSLIDSEDRQSTTAHLVVMVKGGKVVQPVVDVSVDGAIAKSAAEIIENMSKLVDLVLTSQPLYIRGTVPPSQAQRPQS
jgi:hypothetical protein